MSIRLKRLDHVNLRTHRLDTMIEWYTRVLALQSGDRPDFPFTGAWLYLDDRPIVHLVGIEEDSAKGSDVELKLEHFAISATGMADFEQHLEKHGVHYQRSEVPGFKLVQYNIWDPDGNHIHIDFAADEP